MYIYSQSVSFFYLEGLYWNLKTITEINHIFKSIEDIKRFLKDTAAKENYKQMILKDFEGIEEVTDMRRSFNVEKGSERATIVYGVRKVEVKDVV